MKNSEIIFIFIIYGSELPRKENSIAVFLKLGNIILIGKKILNYFLNLKK
jgi:hypothetical protein